MSDIQHLFNTSVTYIEFDTNIKKNLLLYYNKITVSMFKEKPPCFIHFQSPKMASFIIVWL